MYSCTICTWVFKWKSRMIPALLSVTTLPQAMISPGLALMCTLQSMGYASRHKIHIYYVWYRLSVISTSKTNDILEDKSFD